MTRQKRSATKADLSADKWVEAKRLCRLSTRQVELAKALGMNPRKLPGLRPNQSQRWKVPVGQFIEDCYAKRFGDPLRSKNVDGTTSSNATKTSPARVGGQAGRSQRLSSITAADRRVANRDNAQAIAAQQDSDGKAADLLLYLGNLANDIESVLAAAAVTPELLVALSTELHEIATRLAKGEWIAPLSKIDLFVVRKSPPRRKREHMTGPERGWLDDGDIPF